MEVRQLQVSLKEQSPAWLFPGGMKQPLLSYDCDLSCSLSCCRLVLAVSALIGTGSLIMGTGFCYGI